MNNLEWEEAMIAQNGLVNRVHSAAAVSGSEGNLLPQRPSAGPLSSQDLHIFRDRVFAANSPEALFGELSGESIAKLAALNKIYFHLATSCQAKHYRNDEKLLELAHGAFDRLSELYRAAQERIRNGEYGALPGAAKAATDTSVIGVVESEHTAYSLQALIAEGDLALVYRAEYQDDQGKICKACIKIAKELENNSLLENEQNILAQLDHVSLPKLLEGFQLSDGRAVTALTYTEGLNFHQLRDLPMYTNGLAQDTEYHLGWILERQLALLGYLHEKGVVHGSIEPAHLVIQGDKHNVVLVDFCWAFKDPAESDHIKIGQEYYSAPEVFAKATPHPAMDIYGLGKSAVYLLGGDPESGEAPPSLEPMMTKFIRRMVEEDRKERASDAHQLAYHLVAIREELDYKGHGFTPLPTTRPEEIFRV